MRSRLRIRIFVKLKYNSPGCNILCTSVSLIPDYGTEGPPDDFSKITYYLLNSLGATVQTLGSSLHASEIFTFDIDKIPVGAWKVKAMLETSTSTQTATNTLIIDDVLPQAKITYPASSDKICPAATLDKSGNTLYFINVEGIAEDNLGVQSYTLYYGVGENPSQWETAIDPDGKFIETNGKAHGTIGSWNVTHLPGGVYSLKLKVLDGYGNTQCDVTPTFYVEKGVDWSVDGIDTKLFSPNGDGICDDARLTLYVK